MEIKYLTLMHIRRDKTLYYIHISDMDDHDHYIIHGPYIIGGVENNMFF